MFGIRLRAKRYDSAESLDDHIADSAMLTEAWRLVRRAGGSAGIDGVSLAAFEPRSSERFTEMAEAIRPGRYRFQRLRPAPVAKSDGSVRWLEIPTVADRVVLQSMRLALQPRLEPAMLPCSHAYRPGRGAVTAMKDVAAGLAGGLHFVAETDIRRFFESIQYRPLCATLRDTVDEWTNSRLLRRAMRLTRWRWPRRRGLAQGSPLSPILANLALLPFDQQLSRWDGVVVRYADDLVLLSKTRNECQRMLTAATASLRSLGLKLHCGKTRILDSRTESFDFLGFTVSPDRISPSQPNVERLKEAVVGFCDPQLAMELPARIDRINGLLRSFAWYFHQTDCTRLLWNLDAWVQENLQRMATELGLPADDWENQVVRMSEQRKSKWHGSGKPRGGGIRWNGYGQ